MKYFSTFSGIGGFELGIQQAYESLQKLCTSDERQPTGSSFGGTKGQPEQLSELSNEGLSCIGYSEIDKYAIEVYQKHFNHTNYGDIKNINEKELPDFDLLVGGFPCQSFSIAGKRGGFEDTRGTLFFDIARIVREKQPRLLLLENVKGLLSHDKGQTFLTILSTLDDIGYDVQWQVLNSKNHGVPQNRERVFIIGHSRGTSRPEVFPLGQDDGETSNLQGQQTNTLTARYEGAQATGSYVIECEQHAQEINQLNQPTHSNDRVYGTDGVSPTLNTMQGGNRQPFIPEDSKIRRLTPIECERLQGFHDNWTEGLSDTQRYKTLGNAVTVNVIKDIMKKLL